VDREKRYLNHKMRIEIKDGRVVEGTFMCTDADKNIILGQCTETLKGIFASSFDANHDLGGRTETTHRDCTGPRKAHCNGRCRKPRVCVTVRQIDVFLFYKHNDSVLDLNRRTSQMTNRIKATASQGRSRRKARPEDGDGRLAALLLGRGSMGAEVDCGLVGDGLLGDCGREPRLLRGRR